MHGVLGGENLRIVKVRKWGRERPIEEGGYWFAKFITDSNGIEYEATRYEHETH